MTASFSLRKYLLKVVGWFGEDDEVGSGVNGWCERVVEGGKGMVKAW
jgi:hypothetical protein